MVWAALREISAGPNASSVSQTRMKPFQQKAGQCVLGTERRAEGLLVEEDSLLISRVQFHNNLISSHLPSSHLDLIIFFILILQIARVPTSSITGRGACVRFKA